MWDQLSLSSLACRLGPTRKPMKASPSQDQPHDCEIAALPPGHSTQHQSPPHTQAETHWVITISEVFCMVAKHRTLHTAANEERRMGGRGGFQTKTPITLPNEQHMFRELTVNFISMQLFLSLTSLSLMCQIKEDGGPCQMDLQALHTHERVALQIINHSSDHIGLSEKIFQGWYLCKVSEVEPQGTPGINQFSQRNQASTTAWRQQTF